MSWVLTAPLWAAIWRGQVCLRRRGIVVTYQISCESKFGFSTWLGREKSLNLSFTGHFYNLYGIEETQKSP